MIGADGKPRLGSVAGWILALAVGAWALAAHARREARRYERQLNAAWRAEHDAWPFR